MVLRLVEERLDAGLGEAPGARVERLLLRPDDGLGVRVHVEVLAELGPGERVELLDAGDGGGGELVFGAVLVQGDVDLAGAEDDAVDLVRGEDGVVFVGRVGDDPLEVRLAGEVFDGGARERMAEEGFGEE